MALAIVLLGILGFAVTLLILGDVVSKAVRPRWSAHPETERRKSQRYTYPN